MSEGSLIINADALVSRTGTYVKRPIPCLRMYSSVNVAIPSTTLTVITFNTIDTDYTTADIPTGLTYSNGRFNNTTDVDLIIHCAYSITYTANTTSTRVSWLNVGTQAGRHAQVGTAGANFEPTVSSSGVFKVPAGSYIQLNVYQNTGVPLQAVATGYKSPWLSITLL